MGDRTTARRWLRSARWPAAIVTAGYVALLAPDPEPPPPPSTDEHPFAWSRDALWQGLEARYAAARAAGCGAADAASADADLRELDARIAQLRSAPVDPAPPILRETAALTFDLAPRIAACPSLVPAYAAAVARLRDATKRQSERWSPDDRRGREALYELVYGGRAAVEEILLQLPRGAAPPALTAGTDEPSATPAATLLGVRIHSGDVLLSRGGAATSALIARGSDFPGNFSHVALVHVDAGTGAVSIVESHIERGVVVSTPEVYLADRKLRVLVLRPRAELPALAADPLLPHRAASASLEAARARRIPYDFAMDADDGRRLFCSEVAADAYRRLGIGLWPARSHVSSPGVRRWLAAFGVRRFETLEPSDLEHDPQLRVVAEWRDSEALRQDHLDNAVTDAMLEAAERGAPLRYDPWLLPLARVVKGCSAVLNLFGAAGPVPRGMSAQAALRNRWYSARHAAVRARVEQRAAAFEAERGHGPPYWRLLELAREELAAADGAPRPAPASR